MSTGRWRLAAVSAVAAACLGACGAASGPGVEPSPSGAGSTPAGALPSPSTATPTPSTAETPTPTAAPAGVTLRQLGFENGPLDAFSLPSDLVVSTAVDQPNVVTIVVARPSPQTVEDYLRATLPGEGFAVDARAVAGQAMTFEGNGWTGGFTGSGATSAIVLRPV